MLEALVEALQQLFSAKWGIDTFCVNKGHRRSQIDSLLRGKGGSAAGTVVPPPSGVTPLLGSGINDARFAAAVDTNHDNILT